MTYLFDIGNVLLSFNFAPALESLTGENPDPQALEKILTAKDDFEAGQMSIDDYLDYVFPLLDYRGSREDFFTTWNSIFTPIQPTWDLVEKLSAQGHRLILYSNTNAIHAPFCLETYPVFKHFDHAVFSHEIGAIKPHSEFFTRSIEKFDIIPEDTIYIDDLADNIEAGKAHGFHSFCYDYNNHQALTTWLDSFHSVS